MLMYVLTIMFVLAATVTKFITINKYFSFVVAAQVAVSL